MCVCVRVRVRVRVRVHVRVRVRVRVRVCVCAGGEVHHAGDGHQFPVYCHLTQGGVLLPH